MKEKIILTEKEKNEIYQSIYTGSYSKIASNEQMDIVMEKIIGVKNFTEDNYNLKTRQIQVVVHVLKMLIEKLSKKGD